MGLDLRLHVVQCRQDHRNEDHRIVWGYAHTTLDWGRARQLAQALEGKTQPLPEGHDISGQAAKFTDDESIYGRFTTDPYGSPVHYITAGALVPVLEEFAPSWQPGEWLRPATLAYLKAIPHETWIVLWWH